VTRSQSATLSEVTRGRRGRSPPSESPSEPVAKKKRGVGATIDGLKLKISELEASVFMAATELASKSLIIASLKIPIPCCKTSLVPRSFVFLIYYSN
jgi:hypothetical protein